MNYNNNNNGLTNYPLYLDIPTHQHYYSFSSNQYHITQEQQHQPEKQKQKSRGNRKLQRYRRKLRKQGMNADAIARSMEEWVNIDSSKSNKIEQQKMDTTTSLVNEPILRLRTIVAKKHQKNKQRSTILKTKRNINHTQNMGQMQLSSTTTESSENPSTSTNTSFDYIDVSDEILREMLLKAFNGNTEILNHFLNANQNIQFVREYTSLIGRLSYIKLKQLQWNWYHDIGMSRNIWSGRIPKREAEKNSICCTYGRSKRMIEQSRQKIQQQLQEAQHAVQLFEQQTLSKSVHPVNCCSEIKALSSIIHTFIHENQQKIRDAFEYRRQELILNATDHRLVQDFFNLKPIKSQIISARRSWQATAKQTIVDEQIAIFEHRLKTKQHIPSAATLLDHMITNIDTTLEKQNHIIEPNESNNFSSFEFAKMDQLKHDIIHQSIIAAREITENFVKTVLHEKPKCFSNKNNNEFKPEKQIAINNAIEIRRLHMIQCAKYITQYKLATYFK